MLGDIVISVETAARQAEERGHALTDEIRILLVGGKTKISFLHYMHTFASASGMVFRFAISPMNITRSVNYLQLFLGILENHRLTFMTGT